MSKSPAAPASPSQPRGARRALFILGAMLLPLVLLGVVETGLRFAGLGGYPPLLTPVGPIAERPGSTLFVTNNEAPRTWFFANPDKPGTLDDSAIIQPKPPGTIRILAVGESAMKGFPQPRALSSTEFLRAMLSDLWPTKTVEVHNLGITAVASYPVFDTLVQALSSTPDLVVIYAGNNEFFGACGVASLNRAGNSPLAMRFQRFARSTAIVQGLAKLLAGSPAAPQEGKTLMETMMGRSFIAPDDPMRARAASNLGFFVGRMIEQCKARGVPVIVCTPPCNLRDLAPLGDSSQVLPVSMPSAERSAFSEALKAVESRLESDPAGAEPEAKSLIDKAPSHARARFIHARALELTGALDEAAAEYRRAASLDPMPWRPPVESVQAVRDAASKTGALLCDLDQEFQSESRAAGLAAPGWDLFDDHVHPALRGQYLVARSIMRTMAGLTGELRVDPATTHADFDAVAKRLGANDYERYGVAHQMRVLASIPFFKETNPGMLARFDGICRGLFAAWDEPTRALAIEWQKPDTHQGAKRPLSAMVGKLRVSQSKVDEAESLYASAARSVFAYSSWSLEYELYRLACRAQLNKGTLSDEDRTAATAALQRGLLLVNRPGGSSGMTERHVGMLHQTLGEFDKSVPYLNAARTKLFEEAKVACDSALATALARTGRTAEARIIIDDGRRNAGRFAPAYERMAKLLDPAVPPGK